MGKQDKRIGLEKAVAAYLAKGGLITRKASKAKGGRKSIRIFPRSYYQYLKQKEEYLMPNELNVPTNLQPDVSMQELQRNASETVLDKRESVPEQHLSTEDTKAIRKTSEKGDGNVMAYRKEPKTQVHADFVPFDTAKKD